MLYDGCTVSRKQCKKLILKEDDGTNRRRRPSRRLVRQHAMDVLLWLTM